MAKKKGAKRGPQTVEQYPDFHNELTAALDDERERDSYRGIHGKLRVLKATQSELYDAVKEEGYSEGYQRAKEEAQTAFRALLVKGTLGARDEGYSRGLEEGIVRGRCEGEKLAEAVMDAKYAEGISDGRQLEERDQLLVKVDGGRWVPNSVRVDATSQTDINFATKSISTDLPTPTTLEPPEASSRTPNPAPPDPRKFSWADETQTALPPQIFSRLPVRDFSILRSGSIQPFGTLQRRNKRCRITRKPLYSFSNQPPHTTPHFPPSDIGHHHTPTFRHSFTSPPFSTGIPGPLDWDSDPRLSHLSLALQALGWIRR